MSRLPLDVLRLVVDEVEDIPRLFDLAATCRALRYAAERRIYRSVVLICDDESCDAPGEGYAMFLDRSWPRNQIVDRLGLLAQKKHYTFHLIVVMCRNERFMTTLKPFLSDYIFDLGNLHRLDITLVDDADIFMKRPWLSNLLQYPAPSQLQNLRSFSANLLIGGPLLSFLKEKPHLREIGVLVDELPQVEGLFAQTETAPLETLRCTIPHYWQYEYAEWYTELPDIFKTLQKSPSIIRALSINDSAGNRGFGIEELETIGKDLIEFTSLTRLHMTLVAAIGGTTSLSCFKQLARSLVYVGVLSPLYSADQDLSEGLQNLQSFPVLETLHIYDYPPPDATDLRCKWALWIPKMRSSACKNLREIVIDYLHYDLDDLDATACAWILGDDGQWRQFAMSEYQLANVWRSKQFEYGRLLRGLWELDER